MNQVRLLETPDGISQAIHSMQGSQKEERGLWIQHSLSFTGDIKRTMC